MTGKAPYKLVTNLTFGRASKFGELHSVISRDHLGRLLADHDGWRVGVATDHVVHDAGIRLTNIGTLGSD